MKREDKQEKEATPTISGGKSKGSGGLLASD
jgi:hypothetical protein